VVVGWKEVDLVIDGHPEPADVFFLAHISTKDLHVAKRRTTAFGERQVEAPSGDGLFERPGGIARDPVWMEPFLAEYLAVISLARPSRPFSRRLCLLQYFSISGYL